MLFILYFLSYLILYFRTYHCLGSKETTTWTTYAYSDCKLVCCAGKVAARSPGRVAGLSDCEAAFDGRYFEDTNYDFVDLYSASVIAVKCAISCYMGPRYNDTLVISFMNVMPVLWRTCVCVHGGVGGKYFCGRKLTALKRHRTVIDWMPCRRPHD